MLKLATDTIGLLLYAAQVAGSRRPIGVCFVQAFAWSLLMSALAISSGLSSGLSMGRWNTLMASVCLASHALTGLL